MALSMVCRPTNKAERISVRTERDALTHAVTPPRTRLRTSAPQTKPIRRNRSDIGLPVRSFDVPAGKMPRQDFAGYRVREEFFPRETGKFAVQIGKASRRVLGLNAHREEGRREERWRSSERCWRTRLWHCCCCQPRRQRKT